MGNAELLVPLHSGKDQSKERFTGGIMMKQLNAVGWGDFVSNVVSGDPQDVMQKHRRARHERYLQTAAPWQKVADAAKVEAGYQPPSKRVRFVKTAFALADLATKRQAARGVVQLLYDSFSHPVAAGIRSAPRHIRQLLYRAEPYQIDLQIELRPAGNRLVVTGQLLDVSRPEMVGSDVQVMLSDGREYIVNTVTNQFGEFRAEVENSGDLELSLLSPGGRPIVVLLRGALDRLSGSEE